MLYSVKVIKSTTQENPVKKVFFVIKKKVCKKASDRNRVKRIARHAFMDSLKITNTVPSSNLIFFLEHDMIREEYSKIVEKMSTDLRNIFKNKSN
ncbi:MAG: ribonuclease P protein component [Patescibacteria group bacterium]